MTIGIILSKDAAIDLMVVNNKLKKPKKPCLEFRDDINNRKLDDFF